MMKKLTDDEINALAEDIYRDRVFTSDHLRQGDLNMLPVIFMPLLFAGKKMIEKMQKDAPGMIYEHFSEAGLRSINGYPTFFSLHIVSKEDAKKVWEKFEQIKKAVCEVIKHDDNPSQ
uniref:Uncharacterized protein n=1 Tax=viral metagenome TaxID=1070528 RepID=A0A6H1ZZZ2_9ZZZZ